MIAERGLETAGYDTLAETLGEPGEVAAAYIKQALTPAQRAARRAELRRKKFIRTVLAVELAVILFVALLLTGLAIWNHYARIAYDYGSHVPTYYVESQYADPANWPEGFPFNHN